MCCAQIDLQGSNLHNVNETSKYNVHTVKLSRESSQMFVKPAALLHYESFPFPAIQLQSEGRAPSMQVVSRTKSKGQETHHMHAHMLPEYSCLSNR